MCKQTITEIAFGMRDLVETEVTKGFVPLADILDTAVSCFSEDRPERLLRPIAHELATAAIGRHLAEQENWPAVTDCDRLDHAFAELEERGIFCRQDYRDCMTCGQAALFEEMTAAVAEGREPRGYCFYHQQDTDAVIDKGVLHLAFGPGLASPDVLRAIAENHITAPKELLDSRALVEGGLAVGREIAAALRRHGLTVHWPESVAERVGVQIRWQRRRNAEPAGSDVPADAMKWGELKLPYTLRDAIEDPDKAQEALYELAGILDDTAAELRAIGDAMQGHEVRIEGGEGSLLLFGPSAVIAELIGEGLLERPEWLDAEDDDEDRASEAGPEPLHQAVRVQWEDLDAHVDEFIAPLILELWKAGLVTRSSCEGDGSRPVWIQFSRATDAETFLNIVAQEDDGTGGLASRVGGASATGGAAHEGRWDRRQAGRPVSPTRFWIKRITRNSPSTTGPRPSAHALKCKPQKETGP